MNGQTSTLHVRVDEDTKDRAAAALGHMGLSVAEAVRLFLRRVADDQEFRLDLKVPNAESRRAIAEGDEIVRGENARYLASDDLFAALEANRGQ